MTPRSKEFAAESEQGKFTIVIEESGSGYILGVRRNLDGASDTVHLESLWQVKAGLLRIGLRENTLRMVEDFFSTFE